MFEIEGITPRTLYEMIPNATLILLLYFESLESAAVVHTKGER